MIGSDLRIRVRRGRSRTAGPVSLSIFTLIVTAMAVGFCITAFALHAAAGQSAYTQAHGMSSQATVISVRNIQHQSSSRSGSTRVWYTAEITASLNPPVDGVSQTIVHVPRSVSYASGQPVTVLVDPRSPGYAELPGAPDVTAKSWWVALGGAVVCALLAGFLAWRASKAIRARLGY